MPPANRWYALKSLTILLACLTLFTPLLAESASSAGIWGQAARAAAPKTPQDDPLQYIFVVPLSHLDIGFNFSVPDLIPLQKQFLDDATAYAEQYPDYHWTIESVWQLDQWLAQTDDPQQVNRLRALLDQGKIELMANYANMHQGMMGSEEFNRALYPARVYEDAWNLDLETAISDDVPGSSWALPQVLAKNGVRNLVAGINTTFGGRPDIPISDYIFNWQGLDGSQVLTWVSVKGYAEGIFHWRFSWAYADMADATQQFIDAYENGGYPYNAVMALMGFDNDGPDTIIGNGLENIAQWNQEHTWPQIIVGTPTDFFNHMRQVYGDDSFTTYAGDWSGLWENNNTRYPVSTAQNRWSQNALPAAETLAGLRLGLHESALYPHGLLSRTYRDLLVQDEHSGPGGGFELTVADIDANNQWFFERSTRAQQTSGALLRRELAALSQDIASDQPALVVYNGLSWSRSDLIAITPAQLAGLVPLAAGWQLVDLETGQPVPLQWGSDGQSFLFLAQNVPALGYRLYGVQAGRNEPLLSPSPAANEIENDAYRVIVDEDTGEILSIYDKINARELVDANAAVDFNQLIYADQENAFVWGNWEAVPPGDVAVMATVGPVQSQLTIVRAASPISETVITLPANLPRVEIRNTLDHDRTAFADQDTFTWWYYAVMPFALGGSDFTSRFQGPNGWLSPQADWIPGTSHNSRVVRHGSDLRAADGFGVTIANRESYLMAIGSLPYWNVNQPAAPILFQNIFARQDGSDTLDQGWVNFPTWEPGAPRVYTYNFAITSSPGDFDPIAAEQFGGGYNLPLQAAIIRQAQPGPLPGPVGSLIAISQPNVAVLTLKRAEFENPDGADLILRLQEIGGQPQTTVTVSLPFPLAWAELNGLGEQRAAAVPLPTNPLQLTLGAHETVTVRLRPVYLPAAAPIRP
ncbi:MAG: hypothetical protein Fur0021_05180 [Candidatus Promineifilaceae bacterium]